VPPEGWSFGNHGDYSGGKFYKHTDGRKLKTAAGAPEGSKPEGIIAIANAIPDMGALTSINVKKNDIPGAQEEEIYQQARMNKLRVALRDEALTELDVSGIGFGAEGVPLVAKYISGNRALSSLNLSENQILSKESGKALADALAGNTILTELDLSHNQDKYSELDGAGFAQELAVGIKDNGALSVLNLASNNLGGLVLPQGWSKDWKADYSGQEYTHTDGSKQDQHPGKPEGIIALAIAIPDMGALTKFDISKNDLRAEGAKIIATILPKCT
jgi:Ran GTPase-activating protein (RanGAP) involved in mRNA processing and transport